MIIFKNFDEFKNSMCNERKWKKVLDAYNDKDKILDNIYYNADGFLVFKRQTIFTSDQTLYESHIKYYDLHFIIEGKQIIEFDNIKNAYLIKEYNDETDYSFYELKNPKSLNLTKGQLILLDKNDVFKFINPSKKLIKYIFKVTTE